MPKSVLVTGCRTGIGLAIARLLADRGVPVFAAARTEADAARLNAATPYAWSRKRLLATVAEAVDEAVDDPGV